MIFRAISIYIKAKKGINDPTGLVVEEIRDAFMGAVILPLIILIAVVILLGILSFSSLITSPSIVAQVFFWIFVVIVGGYIAIIAILKKFLEQVLTRIESINQKQNP
jgi:magnesium-transporting ATPase (P-type)